MSDSLPPTHTFHSPTPITHSLTSHTHCTHPPHFYLLTTLFVHSLNYTHVHRQHHTQRDVFLLLFDLFWGDDCVGHGHVPAPASSQNCGMVRAAPLCGVWACVCADALCIYCVFCIVHCSLCICILHCALCIVHVHVHVHECAWYCSGLISLHRFLSHISMFSGLVVKLHEVIIFASVCIYTHAHTRTKIHTHILNT